MMKLCSLRHSNASGFSLLEMTLALGVAGAVLASIWQLTGTAAQVRESSTAAAQALAISSAARQYMEAQKPAWLALPAFNSFTTAVRVRIWDGDDGEASIASLVSAGFLPASVRNENVYGQTYQLYILRQDAGTVGSIDADDRLTGLLITHGGQAISDKVGARIAGTLGAPGGFMYNAGNPVPPLGAQTATGNGQGWSVNLSGAGWSNINSPSVRATAGHIATLINLAPQNLSGSGGTGGSGGGGGGGGALDDLTDAATDYGSLYNIYVGQNAGSESALSGGSYNTGVGIDAMRYVGATPPNGYNVALGYQALSGYDLSGGGSGALRTVAIGAQAFLNLSSGTNNTAVGAFAGQSPTNLNRATYIGYQAGLNTYGDDVTLVGSSAGACTSGSCTATGTTIIGAHSGNLSTGINNTLLGAYIGAHAGSHNTVAGYQANANSTTSNEYNVLIGYRAGYNLTDGSHNILIGSGANAPTATSNYRLNIGNTIYGDLSTGQINIGSATIQPDLAFDVARTNSARLPVGTTAQRPTCDATTEGAQRWNTDLGKMEFCNSASWVQEADTTTPSSTPTAPTGTGYIVLSRSEWDGDLGGRNGANEKCLNDLTTYDWMGKTAAVAAGQLVAEKIQAMLWSQESTCSEQWFNPVWSGTYYYAVADAPSVGGASATVASTGGWFADNVAWTGATYFGGSYDYWTMTYSCNAVNFGCNKWASNSASYRGAVGVTTAAGSRSNGGNAVCSSTHRLVCLVHP